MNTIETGPPDMTMPAIPKCGPGPRRTSGSIAAVPDITICDISSLFRPLTSLWSVREQQATLRWSPATLTEWARRWKHSILGTTSLLLAHRS